MIIIVYKHECVIIMGCWPCLRSTGITANVGCTKPTQNIIDTSVSRQLLLPGAKLQAMTQSLAYKILRRRKMSQSKYQQMLKRRATTRNMELAKGATSDEEGNAPPSEAIWRSIRHKDIPRNIRFFLWMLIHDGYKVGSHWEHIAGFEDRADCPTCGVSETTEHILTKCDAPGESQIWELASELWTKKTGEELKPAMGEIMACGAMHKSDQGTTRLYRILVAESAYLIWCLRNERVIQEQGAASIQEIKNRWCKIVNDRLLFDCLLTNKDRYGRKALEKSLVLSTWRKTLKNEDRLLGDWTKETGVSVGVG